MSPRVEEEAPAARPRARVRVRPDERRLRAVEEPPARRPGIAADPSAASPAQRLLCALGARRTARSARALGRSVPTARSARARSTRRASRRRTPRRKTPNMRTLPWKTPRSHPRRLRRARTRRRLHTASLPARAAAARTRALRLARRAVVAVDHLALDPAHPLAVVAAAVGRLALARVAAEALATAVIAAAAIARRADTSARAPRTPSDAMPTARQSRTSSHRLQPRLRPPVMQLLA